MNQIPYGCLLQFLRTGTSSFLIGKHRYINHKWAIFAMSAMTRASAEISAESSSELVFIKVHPSNLWKIKLVGGATTILKNMSSSMGRMTSHMLKKCSKPPASYGKIKGLVRPQMSHLWWENCPRATHFAWKSTPVDAWNGGVSIGKIVKSS